MQIGSFDDEATPRRAEPETPGVSAIAPGVWRIALPLPFPPRGVNCYLLRGAGEAVLVDCGLGGSRDQAVLTAALASLGLTFGDLTALVLTHAHPDHIGPAGDVAAAMGAGARVLMLPDEARRMFALWGAQDAARLAAWNEMEIFAGLSPQEAEEGVAGLRLMSQRIRLPAPAAIAPLADGQTLRLAGRDWRVLWTPGHSDYQLCLVSGDLIITADHILPTISPNVSFYPLSRPNPIADYLASLAKIAALDLRAPLALPGHGAPFTRLAARIAELREGTERRAQAVRAALRELGAPATAIETAVLVFRGRLLTGADRRLAVGETLAHLERLRLDGVVAQTMDGPAARYTLVGGEC